MTASIIYVASPYSGPEPEMQDRYQKAMLATLYLSEIPDYQAFVPISPIVHWHQIAKENNLRTDEEYYWRMNKLLIQQSALVMVVLLEGWKSSVGVAKEIGYAEALNIPVKRQSLSLLAKRAATHD